MHGGGGTVSIRNEERKQNCWKPQTKPTMAFE